MKIGMVLDSPYPPDIRVTKEAKALCEAGLQVGLLAQAHDQAEVGREVTDFGLEIFRIQPPAETSQERRRRYLTLYNRTWREPLRAFVADYAPDVLHAHDLPILRAVLDIAEESGLPVIADLHENMPAMALAYRSSMPRLPKLKDGILKNYRLWRWLEARALKRCARVIVVVAEAAERVESQGVERQQIVIVSNTEDESTFHCQTQQADDKIAQRYQSDWVISYIGGIGPHRGLDTVLDAMPLACAQIPRLRLLIVGAKPSQQQQLTDRASQLGVAGHVDVIGWVPFTAVNDYVMVSQVCLVPHDDFEHTQTTVPHKLFQYMICSKPVLVSSCRPLARIVNDAQAGVVFAVNDSDDFARRLAQMHDAPDALVRMGENGRRAALGPYAWRHDAARLINLYKNFDRNLNS